MTTLTSPNDHISSVRILLLNQMQALSSATTPEALKTEVARSNALSGCAQAVTALQRLEVDYIKAKGGKKSATFIEPPAPQELVGDDRPSADNFRYITDHLRGPDGEPGPVVQPSGFKGGHIERAGGVTRHTLGD